MTAAKNVKRRYKVEFPSENPSLLTEFHSRWRHCCLVVTFTAGLMSFVPECQTASNDVLSVIFVVITYIISDYNCGRVEMDLIKKEPEVDPLHLQAHSNTCEIEENKASSEEGKVSRLEVTGMKAECMDHSYEIKSEIKVEDTPLPTSVVFVKSEVDEDMFDVDRVQQEQKVEVSSEEDEVFPERLAAKCSDSVETKHPTEASQMTGHPGHMQVPQTENCLRSMCLQYALWKLLNCPIPYHLFSESPRCTAYQIE
ncbi:uncharacterized protein [Periplaneta americana]|uniref:uncharacterized protein isoform X10 n=1 Tax=Periplaneta americana TaxID=6978 RepID=UPI0037E72D64